MHKKITPVLVMLFIGAASAYAQRQHLVLDTFKIRGANDVAICNYYKYYKDSSNATIATVMQALLSGRFIQYKTEGSVFNSQYTRSGFWFALAIQNDTSYTLPVLWSFYQNNLGYVLYDITDINKPILIDSILSSQPLSLRKFQTRAPAFKLALPPGTCKLLLVKIYPINADAVYFPSDISTTEDVLRWEVNYSFIMGRYLGYFFTIFILNLFLAALLKAKIHLWHALYIFMIILYSLTENIIDVLYLPDWLYPYFNQLTKTFFLLLAVFFSMQVCQLFTEEKTSFPIFHRVFENTKAIILVLGLTLFISTFIFSARSLILSILRIGVDIAALFSIALLALYVLYASLKRKRRAIIYLLASSFLVISYIDYLIVTLFNIQLFYLRPGNILIGLAIEIILLTAFFLINFSNERKRNYLDLKQKSEENELLSQNIIQVQEQERKRIAEDLHDDVGATLSALLLHVSSFNRKDAATDQALHLFQAKTLTLSTKAANDVRSISHNLLPKDFESTNLFPILQSRVQELNQFKHTFFYLITDGDACQLTDILAVSVYRIINELMTNIVKHAQASQATVQLLVSSDQLQIITEDNGIGLAQSSSNPKGIGLQNISSRVQFWKGTINIDSNEQGTSIIITLPM